MTRPSSPRTLVVRGAGAEISLVTSIPRKWSVGGALLLTATAVARVWAHPPGAGSYTALRYYELGAEALRLKQSLGAWPADGFLAIFFFAVRLELKRQFVVAHLRGSSRAAFRMLAATGGMLRQSCMYVVTNLVTGDGSLLGWAIRRATRNQVRSDVVSNPASCYLFDHLADESASGPYTLVLNVDVGS